MRPSSNRISEMNILSCVFHHSSLFPVAVFEFLILFHQHACAWERTLDGVSCFLISVHWFVKVKQMMLVCYQMYGPGSWDSTIVVTYDRWSEDYVYGDLPSLSKTLAKLTVCNLASWEVYGTCFARVACIEQCTTPLFWIIGYFDFSKYLIFTMHLDICYI